MKGPNYPNELDPSVREALASMLAQDPARAELATALRRLETLQPASSALPTDRAATTRQHAANLRRAAMAIACTTLFVMGLIASTDAWAQVTRDFASPLNEPESIRTLTEPAAPDVVDDPKPGLGMRMLLITHVGLLLLGLMGMAIAWVLTAGKCLIAHRRPDMRICRSRTLERRVLLSGVALYLVGVLFGCLWSQVTWGSPWHWDPKEAVCLLTIAIGLLWLGLPVASDKTQHGSRFEITTHASLATVAFGTVFLMIPLGSHLTTVQASHSYNGLTYAVPTILTAILCFFVACLGVLWLSNAFAKTSNWRPTT